MPTEVATPCPSGPVVVSTPETQWYSGWPGALLSSWRKWRISSRVTAGWPSLSYSAFTACVLVRWSTDHSSIEAWPFESTNRSRLGQIGSFGSNRITRFQIVYTSGASAIGVPGCPDLACCTASMESVRIVLMHSWSIPISDSGGATCVTLMFDLPTKSYCDVLLMDGLHFERSHLAQP